MPLVICWNKTGYDEQVYLFIETAIEALAGRKNLQHFWEASKIHNDKFWWREIKQNVQRELIAKSFKKPVKITLKFILSLIVHNPQNEIFAMLIQLM